MVKTSLGAFFPQKRQFNKMLFMSCLIRFLNIPYGKYKRNALNLLMLTCQGTCTGGSATVVLQFVNVIVTVSLL